MTEDNIAKHTERVAKLTQTLNATERLHAEMQRARREFFGEDATKKPDYAAEHRFAEWYLFERESETLGAIPILVPPCCNDAGDLGDSIAGLFLVENADNGCAVRDLQAGEMLEIADAESLEVGDLLVGRLYPSPQERWSASAATPALRPGKAIAEAFMRDLKKLGLDRRLQQIELEHLLLQQHAAVEQMPVVPGPPPEPIAPLEHLEADLDQLLKSVGDRHQAEVISQQLAVALRPGGLIGPLLDQLAFDTDVDLDKARRLMMEIWNAHHAGAGPESDAPEVDAEGPPGLTLGEQLVRTLDEGVGNNQDIEEVFAQMERLAGVDDDEASEDEGEQAREAALIERMESGDGDVGDLGPLVAEFHWETDTPDATSCPLSLWVELQRNAPVPNTELESIKAPDLMRLLLHIYLRSSPTERSSQVRQAFERLTRFYDWLTVTQELDQRAVLSNCEGVLLEHLDRLQTASLALSNDAPAEQSPGLLQVEEIGADGFGARDDDGGSHWLIAAKSAVEALEVGDLLLAGLRGPEGDGATSMHGRLAGMVVVMPSDARSLIE